MIVTSPVDSIYMPDSQVSRKNLLAACKTLLGDRECCFINWDFETKQIWQTERFHLHENTGIGFEVYQDFNSLDWNQTINEMLNYYELYNN